MKVVMISPYPRSNVKAGGWEAASHALIQGMVKFIPGLEMHVFDLRRSDKREKIKIGTSLFVYRYPMCERFQMVRRGYPERFYIQREIKNLKPDIIHSQNLGINGLIATSVSHKTVVTIHGIANIENPIIYEKGLPHRKKISSSFLQMHDRTTLQRAKIIHHVSQFSEKYYQEIAGTKSVVIPNTVNSIFDSNGACHNREKTILIIGHISRVKNSIQAIEWLEHVKEFLKDYTIVMAGGFQCDDAYKEEYLLKVKNSPLNKQLQFTNALTDEELVVHYRRARLIISFSRQDNNPLALIQALAMSVPILAPRVGGIPEIVSENSNGYLYDRDNENDFSGKLHNILEESTNERLRSNCYDYFKQHYAEELIVSKMYQLYQRVCQ
ncbi:MAG: glycosyltransferase family 4 protein [Bacteroidota bacterium]